MGKSAFRFYFISIILMFGLLVVLIGCSNNYPLYEGYLTREEVLEADPDADLFELDGAVFVAIGGWTEEDDLEKGERVGIIKEGMATKLPEGVHIYEPKENKKGRLIADLGDEERIYLVMVGE